MSSERFIADESPAEAWNARYRETASLWTPEPNALLVQFAAGLAPGRALDVGAGEGRNAIWVASRGWRVSALDVSDVALARAAEHAAAAGVRLECVTADWREHPFGESAFELVVVSFMHPQPDERDSLFERARRALAPAGHLFVVGVDVVDHGRRGPPDRERLYTPQRLRGALRGFDVLRCEQHESEQEHRTGRRHVTDVVAVARRA